MSSTNVSTPHTESRQQKTQPIIIGVKINTSIQEFYNRTNIEQDRPSQTIPKFGLNPHNINKLSCIHQSLQETQHLCHPEHCLIFVGPEHQSSKIYPAFSNYVKTTFNNGLSLSEVDLSHLKREMTNHGSNRMEVDWGGNIDSIYSSTTKHGPSLMEVDWGGNIDPNHTSSGCMLMQVDWGRKL